MFIFISHKSLWQVGRLDFDMFSKQAVESRIFFKASGEVALILLFTFYEYKLRLPYLPVNGPEKLGSNWMATCSGRNGGGSMSDFHYSAQ